MLEVRAPTTQEDGVGANPLPQIAVDGKMGVWYQIRAACCQTGNFCVGPCGGCAEVVFNIYGPTGDGEPIGEITRSWPGCLKQDLTQGTVWGAHVAIVCMPWCPCVSRSCVMLPLLACVCASAASNFTVYVRLRSAAVRSRSHHVCDVCVSLQHLPRGCDAVPEGHLDQRCHADRFLVYVFISGRGRCCLVAADIRGTTCYVQTSRSASPTSRTSACRPVAQLSLSIRASPTTYCCCGLWRLACARTATQPRTQSLGTKGTTIFHVTNETASPSATPLTLRRKHRRE